VELSARLTRAPEASGYSRAQLGHLANVGQSTISRIERGEGDKVGLDKLRKIAEVLAIPVTELMPEAAPNDAARLLPRTVQAIPRDAPASLMDLLDRQVEGIVKLVFEGPSRLNQLPPHRHEKEDDVNDDARPGADGFFKIKFGTLDTPLVPPVRARELALV